MIDLLSVLLDIHPLLLKETLEFIKPESYCICTIKDATYFNVRYVNKKFNTFYSNNIVIKPNKQCIVISPNINYNNRLDNINCSDHKITQSDVQQLSTFFRNQVRKLDTIYNSESIVSPSSLVDTSNFIHSPNTLDVKEFIRKYYNDIIYIGEDCCSGKGFKIVLT